MSPEIVVLVDELGRAFDVVEQIRERTLLAALSAARPDEDPARWSVIQIVETVWPSGPRAGKLRGRVSTWTPKQWAKVRTRAIDDEMVVNVALLPGEPFDDSHLADEMPPGFPKSELKGIASGPVSLLVMGLPAPDGNAGAEVRLEIRSDEPAAETAAIGIFEDLAEAATDLAGVVVVAFGGSGLALPLRPLGDGDPQSPSLVRFGPAADQAVREGWTRIRPRDSD